LCWIDGAWRRRSWWLEKRKAAEGGGDIRCLYTRVFVVLSGLFTLFMIPLVQQAIEFWKSFPHYLDRLQTWLAHIHQRHHPVPDYAHLIGQAAGRSCRRRAST